MNPLAPQVEEAIAQTSLLGKLGVAVDGQRERIRSRLNRQLADSHLDRARREPWVDGIRRAGDHLAGDRDHALEAKRLGRLEQRAGAVDHALDHAVVIAQIEEQDVTVVALPMEPSGEPNREAGMLTPELAALVGAKTMHRLRPRRRYAGPASLLPGADPGGTPRKSRTLHPPDRRAAGPDSFASA